MAVLHVMENEIEYNSHSHRNDSGKRYKRVLRKVLLTDIMEVHFVSIPKLISDWYNDKLNPWNDVLARWLLLLGTVDRRNNKVYEDIYRELEAIAMKDETLYKALEAWKKG